MNKSIGILMTGSGGDLKIGFHWQDTLSIRSRAFFFVEFATTTTAVDSSNL